jgi:hypothetical protein
LNGGDSLSVDGDERVGRGCPESLESSSGDLERMGEEESKVSSSDAGIGR